MRKRISSWVELFQSLREAFIGVMEAEVQSLRLDLKLTQRQLVQAAGFAALAVFVCFWAIGVLVFLLIQVASLWLPVWAASLAVLVVLAVIGVGLIAAARGRLQRIEAPKAMIRRHVQEHMDWWEDEVLTGSEDPAGGATAIADKSPESAQESP